MIQHVHLLNHLQRLSVYETNNYENVYHCVDSVCSAFYIPSTPNRALSTLAWISGGPSFNVKRIEVAQTCLTFSVLAHPYSGEVLHVTLLG